MNDDESINERAYAHDREEWRNAFRVEKEQREWQAIEPRE